jgi:hypothetical protein
MTIAEVRQKCKALVERFQGLGRLPRDILIFGVLILASSLSFGLGYLTGLDAQGRSTPLEVHTVAVEQSSGGVVASKSGTKYYYPQCSGASRIAEANKVYFASKGEAESAGYTLASNCSAQ